MARAPYSRNLPFFNPISKRTGPRPQATPIFLFLPPPSPSPSQIHQKQTPLLPSPSIHHQPLVPISQISPVPPIKIPSPSHPSSRTPRKSTPPPFPVSHPLTNPAHPHPLTSDRPDKPANRTTLNTYPLTPYSNHQKQQRRWTTT